MERGRDTERTLTGAFNSERERLIERERDRERERER
jgi:hypothetical protein